MKERGNQREREGEGERERERERARGRGRERERARARERERERERERGGERKGQEESGNTWRPELLARPQPKTLIDSRFQYLAYLLATIWYLCCIYFCLIIGINFNKEVADAWILGFCISVFQVPLLGFRV